MHLEARDYKTLTTEEEAEYQRLVDENENKGMTLGAPNQYGKYPEAVKHWLSLFPNNHIVLSDIKKRKDIHDINLQFQKLVHDEGTKEQDILGFINHDPEAYYIIGSIFNAGGFGFGHHDCYIFPEFQLGDDYRPDYLLIGKGSGGYEFIFVELERSNGRITLQDGHPGQAMRAGNFQVDDWKSWLDSNFHTLQEFFDAEKGLNGALPNEFHKYDSTRMHYVVVAGTRDDYDDKTYWERRKQQKDSGVTLLHYDNLFDSSEALLRQDTF